MISSSSSNVKIVFSLLAYEVWTKNSSYLGRTNQFGRTEILVSMFPVLHRIQEVLYVDKLNPHQ